MAKLSPVFNDQTIDVNGDPFVGAQIFTYVAGSSTKQTVYTDAAGLVPHSNPIILDSLGFPTQGSIWIPEGISVKFVLAPPTDTDPPTSPVKTIDNVQGVNDASVSISEWQASGVTPTYISSTSFSLPGDQTTEFQKGRRAQFTTGLGTFYGKIVNSVFTTLTTVTVLMDGSSTLDSGLSVVNLSLLHKDPSSLPNPIEYLRSTVVTNATSTPLWDAAYGEVQDWSGAVTITGFPAAPRPGAQRQVYPTAGTILTNGGAISVQGNANVSAATGDAWIITAVTTSTFDVRIIKKNGAATSPVSVPVRQTVLSGPVDSNGYAAFGGSIGSTTVTAAGTLICNAANGFNSSQVAVNRVGTISNPSWTGLSTNGQMYLYLDIAIDGTCTTGSTTLLPTYRWGGTDVITNNQFTFNVQEMVGKVGNGSAAVQTYRVFVGEVTVAGGIVTAIIWHALLGRAVVTQATIALASTYVLNTNIGTTFALNLVPYYICKTAEGGCAIGDRIRVEQTAATTASGYGSTASITGNNTIKLVTDGTAIGSVANAGSTFHLTAANWSFECMVIRGF